MSLLLLAVGCAQSPVVGDLEEDVPSFEEEEEEEFTFDEDPAFDQGKDQEPEALAGEVFESADSIVFAGDPFADSGARVIAADTGNVITEENLWDGEMPESRLVELEEIPEIGYDEALLEQAAELGLARLRARYLSDVLEGDAKVMVPEGIRTFGEVLPVKFRMRNPLGDPVQLIPSPSGFILELDWTVERWLPIGSHDRVQRHRFFRIAQQVSLQPDQEFLEYTELPLVVGGDQGSVWLVQVDARLRCNGAAFEERLLPVHEINFQAARFLVLPPGWKSLEDAPLANLKRVLLMSSEEVDRHVLVCVALLKGEERQAAVQLLLDGLRLAPTPGRVLTITQSLQWLTGEHIGSMPGDWFRWAARRKMAASR
ncbi:MAG: hypothetical protein O3A95_01460 [Planctomycetota bacterium]|nr:hypothetical protein [Planctomycetota bacterium]MDA1112952.1 hypothetical protein [Planctomycetota bacterium]